MTSSENPSGAGNQQETATRDPQRLHARPEQRSVTIQSDPHGDVRSQAEMTWPRRSDQLRCGVTTMPKVAKFLVG